MMLHRPIKWLSIRFLAIIVAVIVSALSVQEIVNIRDVPMSILGAWGGGADGMPDGVTAMLLDLDKKLYGLALIGFAVAVAAYVVQLLYRQLQQHIGTATSDFTGPARVHSRAMGVTMVIAVVITVIYSQVNAGSVRCDVSGMFGVLVSSVTTGIDAGKDGKRESHENRQAANTHFDHSLFNTLLAKYVNEAGLVDYAGLFDDSDRLSEYLQLIAGADLDLLPRDEELAMLINAYNAFVLQLILDYWDGGNLKSVRDIPEIKRWKHVRWRMGGRLWSLNQLEHEQIRPRFQDPRIHWALVCAARGCPKLRPEAYTANRLEVQLADQAQTIHANKRWFRFDPTRSIVYLTKIYDWYHKDFTVENGTKLDHAAQYVPGLRQAIDAGCSLEIEWIHYDWKLNCQESFLPSSHGSS